MLAAPREESRQLPLSNRTAPRATRAGWAGACIVLLLLAPLLAVAEANDAAAVTRRHSARAGGEVKRFVFSRQVQQDAAGFYYQPAGLCEDYPEETTTSEKVARDFEILRETGTKLLRVGIGWDGIEEKPGEYKWRHWDEVVDTAQREGVTLLPYVCYTPEWATGARRDGWREPPRNLDRFGKFMSVIASRYRGTVRSWELWNEPDNRDYWRGSPKQFARMFTAAARAVRKADPHAVVVLGGLAHGPDSSFFNAITANRRLSGYFDVLNFHGYFETWDSTPAEEYLDRINGYAAAVGSASPDRTPDMWLAEFGYSSGKVARKAGATGSAVTDFHSPEFQAVALLRHHILALAAEKLSLTAWFRIRDLNQAEQVIGDDHNRHFGIVDAAGRPKPAFEALRLWQQLFGQAVRRVPISVARSPSADTQAFAFERMDGTLIIAAWEPRIPPAQSDSHAAPAETTVEIQLSEAFSGTLRMLAPAAAIGETTFENGTVTLAMTDSISIALLRRR